MSQLQYPLNSLKQGHWFKLICGASFQHLRAVRNLTLAYTLAGADCIDVAADPAVIAAAFEALQVAGELANDAVRRGYGLRRGAGTPPLLMVSLNDGEDPHFRKAEFNPAACPPDCPRPCERICPAQAIVFNGERGQGTQSPFSGVIDQRCYGCGRCLPVCPIQHIVTRSYVATPGAIAPLVLSTGVDAVEIHTQVGRLEDFKRLWSFVTPWVKKLKVVAISCPDGEGLIDYLWAIYDAIAPLPCPLIWQTDGRPMSGDIGRGATRAAVKLGQKVLAANLPGVVQLAGGTNNHTVAKLKAAGLLKPKGQRDRRASEQGNTGKDLLPRSNTPLPLGEGEGVRVAPLLPLPPSYIAGIAYGSYARVLLSPILDQLEQQNGDLVAAPVRLEDKPDLLWRAVDLAHSLVSQLKFPVKLQQPPVRTMP